jgi:hypothetical protein
MLAHCAGERTVLHNRADSAGLYRNGARPAPRRRAMARTAQAPDMARMLLST